jgi:hypothetical protein
VTGEVLKERQVSMSQKIKDRFLAGETLNTSAVQQEYGCSSGLLSLVKKEMIDAGYRFKSTRRNADGKSFIDWRLIGTKRTAKAPEPMPEGPASSWDPAAVVEPVEVRQSNGRVELPRLGQQVTISLLAVNEHGVVSIGLRDGSRTWLLQLTGQTEKST